LKQKLKTLEVYKKELKDVKNLTYYKQELFTLTLYGEVKCPLVETYKYLFAKTSYSEANDTPPSVSLNSQSSWRGSQTSILLKNT